MNLRGDTEFKNYVVTAVLNQPAGFYFIGSVYFIVLTFKKFFFQPDLDLNNEITG
jgi:hypothetical protein